MITLVPVGGLANRMRTIASAISLAQHCNSPLRIIWFKVDGLNCRFDQLFQQPASFPNVEVIEASLMDTLLYDRPRKRNFRIPHFFQKFLFKSSLYEDSVISHFNNGFDFITWAQKEKNVYIASYSTFFPYSSQILNEFFCPVQSIQEQIGSISGTFGNHTIGIHIRRTDNIQSIKLSPLSLFIEQIEAEIKQDEQVRFYLASDSPEDKSKLIQLFGDKIHTHDFTLGRNTSKGIQDALAELFVLSGTQKIIGSCWSSFSEIAAQLTDIPCVILKKEEQP